MIDSLLNKLPVSRRFSTDILWNLASFVILGISGILLNVLIPRYYDAHALGVFNQTFTLYALVAQFAVLGIHLSVLRYTSENMEELTTCKKILSSAVAITTLIAAVSSLVYYFLREIIGYVLSSPDVAEAITYTVPGLFLFALNKVFLNFINGRRQMKAYAVFQALRYMFLIVFLSILILSGAPGNFLPAIFTLSEALLFLLLAFFTARSLQLRWDSAMGTWIKAHVRFGARAIGGNIFSDLNPRVDILILGIFATDQVVGVYSFAAMLVEGFSQLPALVRANVNPLISKSYFNQGARGLQAFTNKGKRLGYIFLAPFGMLAILMYPLLFLIIPKPEIRESWFIFGMLMMGLVASIGYQPFMTLLNQTGYPGRQSLLFAWIFSTNVILNVILASSFGMIGSAIATAMILVLQVGYLVIITYRTMGVRI